MMLSSSVQRQLQQVFAGLEAPVTLLVFTNSEGDGTARDIDQDAKDLVEEVAGFTDGKVSIEAHDLAAKDGFATVYGIDKVPAIAVLGGPGGKRDFGIRFFGVPSGYEFGTLIEDIAMVSRQRSDLSATTRETLARLQAPLHIQVFVTPTCPYCPRAVLLAHKLAFESELVTADMVDASGFPELADRYQVYGVPRTIVNETLRIDGAMPEGALVEQFEPFAALRS